MTAPIRTTTQHLWRALAILDKSLGVTKNDQPVVMPMSDAVAVRTAIEDAVKSLQLVRCDATASLDRL